VGDDWDYRPGGGEHPSTNPTIMLLIRWMVQVMVYLTSRCMTAVCLSLFVSMTVSRLRV
jgi:hypothetical protein